MHTIQFREKIENKKQAIFVILYALDGQPWKNYREKMSDKRPEMIIPTFLVSNRWDGTIGFIGGFIDNDETFEQTIKHEALEEAGFDIGNRKLEEIVAHDIGPITTHAFACEMTYQELKSIQTNISNASDLGSEVTGVFLPHLVDYETEIGKKAGIVQFLQSSMAPSVREEVIYFLIKKNIFNRTNLSDICNRSGYNLEELLI